MKFKVGDSVTPIKDHPEGAEVRKGDVLKITEVLSGEDHGGNYRVDGGWYIHGNYLQLIAKRGKPVKGQPIRFVATYDKNDHDPVKTFTDRKALTTWLKEARDDEDIVFSSIKVFEVKKELKVSLDVKLRAIRS